MTCPDDIPTLLQDLTKAGIRFPPTATKYELQQLWKNQHQNNNHNQDNHNQHYHETRPVEDWSLTEILQALKTHNIRFSPLASRAELEETLLASDAFRPPKVVESSTKTPVTPETRSTQSAASPTSESSSSSTSFTSSSQDETRRSHPPKEKVTQNRQTNRSPSRSPDFSNSQHEKQSSPQERQSPLDEGSGGARGTSKRRPRRRSSTQHQSETNDEDLSTRSTSDNSSNSLEVMTAEILEKRTDDYLRRQAKRNKRRGIEQQQPDDGNQARNYGSAKEQQPSTVVVPIVEHKRTLMNDNDNTGKRRRTTSSSSPRRPRTRRPQSIVTDQDERSNDNFDSQASSVPSDNVVVVLPVDSDVPTSGRRRRPSRAERQSQQANNERIYSPYNNVKRGNPPNSRTSHLDPNSYARPPSRSTRRRDSLDRLSDAVQNAADYVMFGYYESTGGEPSSSPQRRQRRPSPTTQASVPTDDDRPPRHWRDRMEERFDSMLGIHEEGEFYNSWLDRDNEEGDINSNGAPPYSQSSSSRRRRGGDPLSYGYSYLSQGANLLNDFFLGGDYPRPKRYTNGRPPSPRQSSSVTFGNGGKRGSLLSVLGAAGRVGQSLCTWPSVGGALPRRVVAAGVAVVGLCARQYKFRAMVVSLLAFRALGEVAANSWMDEGDDAYYYYEEPNDVSEME